MKLEYGAKISLLWYAIILEGEGSICLRDCIRATSSVFIVLLQFIFKHTNYIIFLFYEFIPFQIKPLPKVQVTRLL